MANKFLDVLKAVGTVGGSVAGRMFGVDVAGALKSAGVIKDPEAEARVKAVLAEVEAKIIEGEMRFIEAVNNTMQAEAKSEHWLQWSWRPIVGLTFSAVLINNFILLPYFPHLQPIELPEQAWLSMLAILGVAAGTRGWEKITKARNGNGHGNGNGK